MTFEVPSDLHFLETHEWARLDDGVATIGISDFAQDELGDVVYVEFPEVGDAVAQDEAFGVIESIKAVSDLYAPLSGEVTDRNEALFDAPEQVNDDPYGDGWMLRVDVADEGELDALLDADAYGDQIE